MTKIYSREELIDAAQRCADVYATVANRLLRCNIPVPVPIDFDLCERKPKAAGEASSTMNISINMILYEDNVQYILNDTIPHEIGHLVQFAKMDLRGVSTQGHGAEWKAVMQSLGKDPHKYHHLDVSKAVEHYKQAKKEKRAEAKALKQQNF